jgi:RimJ/RimL family protein N-acetyltransferase/GNAT superfamily N-acetyltransferase
MEWKVRELDAEETYPLRRAVSADGRRDLPTMRHELDAAHGSWHLGAVDTTGQVVATSSFFLVPCPLRPEAQPAVQLELMAVDPMVQGKGVGTAVLTEAIRRLKATAAVLVWARARDEALPFYERFGFTAAAGSGFTPVETGSPHHIIELDLRGSALGTTALQLHTERLLLRRWREGDRDPFARLNSDPEVMEHFLGPLSREESDAFIDRIEGAFDKLGYGLWAIEVPGEIGFIGYVGLASPKFRAHFTPAVEVGWRLRRSSWGRGFATEAARVAVADGFGRVGLDEIVSFTVPANVRSTRVMKRLGMTHDSRDDFDHPQVPAGHRLCRHVLYRLKRSDWQAIQ